LSRRSFTRERKEKIPSYEKQKKRSEKDRVTEMLVSRKTEGKREGVTSIRQTAFVASSDLLNAKKWRLLTRRRGFFLSKRRCDPAGV